MAYTLKTTGIAANLVVCVAVDEDGTIKDFKANAVTLGTGVAASVTSSTWKSATRSYFATTANGGFDFNGVRFDTTEPTVNQDDADGMSVFIAFAGSSAKANTANFMTIGAGEESNMGPSADGSGKITFVTGGTMAVGATTLPTDGTTKFSIGYNYRNNVDSEAFYGLESGSLASDGTAGACGGFGTTRSIWHIGGLVGNGNHPHKPFIHAVFNKKLSTAEMQSLHGDGSNTWITTLFEAAAGASAKRMALLGVG